MTYKPTVLDATSDLRRCIYASYSPEGFKDPNFVTFFKHAQRILSGLDSVMEGRVIKMVNERMDKAQDQRQPISKRREDLLTTAILLQNAFYIETW